MQFRTFLLLTGLLALVFGVAFALAPAPVLALYAVTTDVGGLVMSRFFGAALINLGLVLLLVRGVADPKAQGAIALGSCVGSIAGLVVALTAQLNGVVNAVGWSSVAIYLLLALGYGYFRFAPPRTA